MDPAAVDACAELLQQGQIVAVKGLGGYHLAVDAGTMGRLPGYGSASSADEKPFAVMVADLATARRLARAVPP